MPPFFNHANHAGAWPGLYGNGGPCPSTSGQHQVSHTTPRPNGKRPRGGNCRDEERDASPPASPATQGTRGVTSITPCQLIKHDDIDGAIETIIASARTTLERARSTLADECRSITEAIGALEQRQLTANRHDLVRFASLARDLHILTISAERSLAWATAAEITIALRSRGPEILEEFKERFANSRAISYLSTSSFETATKQLDCRSFDCRNPLQWTGTWRTTLGNLHRSLLKMTIVSEIYSEQHTEEMASWYNADHLARLYLCNFPQSSMARMLMKINFIIVAITSNLSLQGTDGQVLAREETDAIIFFCLVNSHLDESEAGPRRKEFFKWFPTLWTGACSWPASTRLQWYDQHVQSRILTHVERHVPQKYIRAIACLAWDIIRCMYANVRQSVVQHRPRTDKGRSHLIRVHTEAVNVVV